MMYSTAFSEDDLFSYKFSTGDDHDWFSLSERSAESGFETESSSAISRIEESCDEHFQFDINSYTTPAVKSEPNWQPPIFDSAPFVQPNERAKRAVVINKQALVPRSKPRAKQAKQQASSRNEPDDLVFIGKYSLNERRSKVATYLKRRLLRSLHRETNYSSRKQFADVRPRIGGRFLKIH
jgi:hypothetical protein